VTRDLDDLRRELEAAGIGPNDWPYPGDTSGGIHRNINHQAEVARIQRESGAYEALLWMTAREWEIWDEDPRNPAVRAAHAESVDAADHPSLEGIDTLSREQVLDARRRWQHGEGHPWTLAAVAKSTYIRARHRHRLVPWPKEYQDKLTP
jgi:hypothetical protein